MNKTNRNEDDPPPYAVRQIENKKNPWLRWQVGFVLPKTVILPSAVKGHLGITVGVNVFYLLGWGSTVLAAESMAARSRRWW